ncbi:MAG: hypothetical protein V3T49_05660 [Dehalococcoidia bacterium]
MKKIFSLVLVLALVSIITVAGTATASAGGKHKDQINLTAELIVIGIEGVETDEKGWTTIAAETLAPLAPIEAEGWASLDGLYLSAVQSSREKFSEPLPFGVAEKGKSTGTFYMSTTPGGDVRVVGEYNLKLSHSDACQILGQGKWKAVDGIIDGKGKITTCTNFVPAFGTFVSTVTVTGKAALLD